MKRLTLIYVDKCPNCSQVHAPSVAFAKAAGFDFVMRKPTLFEVTARTWPGYPALLLEWSSHKLILAGSKAADALMTHAAVWNDDSITPAQLQQRLSRYHVV